MEPDPLTKEQRDQLLNVGALGLAGEGGEIIDLIKKHLFHGKPLDHDKAVEELGDVLWYVQCLAEALDVGLAEVAQKNADKLKKRYPNGFRPGGGIR
jgi:NTP pyrophosphatase (non-canonical NTP hydrolase)